jgi:hypothetical protein
MGYSTGAVLMVIFMRAVAPPLPPNPPGLLQRPLVSCYSALRLHTNSHGCQTRALPPQKFSKFQVEYYSQVSWS